MDNIDFSLENFSIEELDERLEMVSLNPDPQPDDITWSITFTD